MLFCVSAIVFHHVRPREADKEIAVAAAAEAARLQALTVSSSWLIECSCCGSNWVPLNDFIAFVPKDRRFQQSRYSRGHLVDGIELNLKVLPCDVI